MNYEIKYVQRKATWIAKAEQVAKIQQMRKKFEAQEKQLIAELKDMSEGVSSKGGGYFFTRSTRAGTVDFSIIPELQGIDLDFYRKDEIEQWKLTIENQ